MTSVGIGNVSNLTGCYSGRLTVFYSVLLHLLSVSGLRLVNLRECKSCLPARVSSSRHFSPSRRDTLVAHCLISKAVIQGYLMIKRGAPPTHLSCSKFFDPRTCHRREPCGTWTSHAISCTPTSA